jgi:hypothetical protein
VPKELWDALAPVVSTSIEEDTWLLPDLADCKSTLAKIEKKWT